MTSLTLTLTKATILALMERANLMRCTFAELSSRAAAPEIEPFAAALRKAHDGTISALRYDLRHRGIMALTSEGERVDPTTIARAA
jgi:hypothetical protein